MRARGFTLVEMLVTLALMALVSTLLWQAMAIVAQLETRLERTRAIAGDDQLRRAWIEQALFGVMTGADGDPERLEGNERRLSAYMSMPPWPGLLGPEFMTLTIERDQHEQRLLARRPGSDTPLELWRWSGDVGRFDYLDGSGQWLDAWPPANTAQADPLPAAIRLRGPPAGPVLMPVVTTQIPMLRQRDVQPDSPSG